MRGFLLLLAAISPTAAQFNNLRTDYRGDQLFFVSNLNYKEQAPAQGGKVYVADASGIHLLYASAREWITYPNFPSVYGTTNYYDVVALDRASNGTATAITGQRECVFSGTVCEADQRYTRIYGDRGQEIAGEIGPASVSRNGEWALAGTYRINLQTGQRRLFGYYIAWSIADNGTVFTYGDSRGGLLTAMAKFTRTDGYVYQFSESATQGTSTQTEPSARG